jgi:hypothetical protein
MVRRFGGGEGGRLDITRAGNPSLRVDPSTF